MKKHILLFDMDGVLIRSRGYYLSLQTSIEWIGKALGIPGVTLSMEVISKLEAAGIFYIWDHLTFFSALLLQQSWKVDPGRRIPEVLKPAGNDLAAAPEIDFWEYTSHFKNGQLYSAAELAEVAIARCDPLNSAQLAYLTELFDSSREIKRSPVLPIMQELILGSQLFTEIYNLPSQFDLPSYPQQYDQPCLSAANYASLQDWLKLPDHHAAIFTNRPNLTDGGGLFGTPEAELGAQQIGLEGMPLIGAGSLEWLAKESGAESRAYHKPNPEHALAALQAALGRPVETSLRAAVQLASQAGAGSTLEPWQALIQADVYVFEDSTGGLISAQKAAGILADRGIPVNLKLIGIGQQSDKLGALLDLADQICPDINASPLIDLINP